MDEAKDISVVALVKGDERYIILYRDRDEVNAMRCVGRWASDPELAFDWYDAAHFGKAIRKNRR